MVPVTVYILLCYIYKDVLPIWSRSQFISYCVIFIKTFCPYGNGHSLHLIVLTFGPYGHGHSLHLIGLYL